MKLRTVIVEDSRLARNELKHLIEQFDFLDLIGEAENAIKGKALIEKSQPDILFLDINMPGKDGFELLESLDQVPRTIFTTAYDEYAIKSFEYNTLDYLLKPISKDRFSKAMDKLKAEINEELVVEETVIPKEESLNLKSQIFIKDGNRCWLVKLDDIQLFEVDGNYTKVYFEDQKPLVYKSLQQIEQKLPSGFLRVNRQEIIHMKYVISVVPWFNGKLKLTLTNGKELEVSRRQSSELKKQLSF